MGTAHVLGALPRGVRVADEHPSTHVWRADTEPACLNSTSDCHIPAGVLDQVNLVWTPHL